MATLDDVVRLTPAARGQRRDLLGHRADVADAEVPVGFSEVDEMGFLLLERCLLRAPAAMRRRSD